MDIVAIKWLDAAEDSDGFRRESEITPGAELLTVGMLVTEKGKFYVVAVDWWEDEGRWRSVHSIPKSLVTEVRVVKWERMKVR